MTDKQDEEGRCEARRCEVRQGGQRWVFGTGRWRGEECEGWQAGVRVQETEGAGRGRTR